MLNARERRAAQALAEIRELVELYGGPGHTARLLDVHQDTVGRWLEGTSKAPESARIALRAAARGQVPGMETKHWEGWSFGRDGQLYTPSGQAFGAGDIMAMQYERALIKHLQNEVRTLEAKLHKALELGHTAANDPLLRLGSR